MAWQGGSERRHAPLTPAILTTEPNRVILHVDMDAFFAEIEIRDNPSLRGKPVAIGGRHRTRGVVTAANYIAREYGLKAGMSSFEAHRRCPNGVFLPVNGEKYVAVSKAIMEELQRFSPSVRPLSVDEASLDITGCERLLGPREEIGRQVRAMIRSKFRLPCSVGIGPNRLVAKMASNLGKPDGLLVLPEDKVAETFAPLPVDKMVGIGASTRGALESVGIHTLGELAKAPESILKARFGIVGYYLKDMAQGKWTGRMKQDEEREPSEKSIGHSRTFRDNIVDLHELRAKLVALSEMVARRVRRGGWVGHVLTLTVRYPDFHTPTHQGRLPTPTDDEEIIIDHAWRLLAELHLPGQPVRLMGVSLGSLTQKEEVNGQLDLFLSRAVLRRESLHRALDTLRDQYGEKIITRAMSRRYLNPNLHAVNGGVLPVERGYRA